MVGEAARDEKAGEGSGSGRALAEFIVCFAGKAQRSHDARIAPHGWAGNRGAAIGDVSWYDRRAREEDGMTTDERQRRFEEIERELEAIREGRTLAVDPVKREGELLEELDAMEFEEGERYFDGR